MKTGPGVIRARRKLQFGGVKGFDQIGGGYLSSDGGGLILRELERHSGLLRDFSGCFIDYRDQRTL